MEFCSLLSNLESDAAIIWTHLFRIEHHSREGGVHRVYKKITSSGFKKILENKINAQGTNEYACFSSAFVQSNFIISIFAYDKMKEVSSIIKEFDSVFSPKPAEAFCDCCTLEHASEHLRNVKTIGNKGPDEPFWPRCTNYLSKFDI